MQTSDSSLKAETILDAETENKYVKHYREISRKIRPSSDSKIKRGRGWGDTSKGLMASTCLTTWSDDELDNRHVPRLRSSSNSREEDTSNDRQLPQSKSNSRRRNDNIWEAEREHVAQKKAKSRLEKYSDGNDPSWRQDKYYKEVERKPAPFFNIIDFLTQPQPTPSSRSSSCSDHSKKKSKRKKHEKKHRSKVKKHKQKTKNS